MNFLIVKQIVDKTAKKINLLKECKQIFTFKPYLILLSAFVTNQIAIQVSAYSI